MLPIISFTEENIAGIVGWAGEIVSGVMPLLVVIIGIAIGAYLIKVILNLRG
jgi:hypothetical protein